jgi:hypothetical protein
VSPEAQKKAAELMEKYGITDEEIKNAQGYSYGWKVHRELDERLRYTEKLKRSLGLLLLQTQQQVVQQQAQ